MITEVKGSACRSGSYIPWVLVLLPPSETKSAGGRGAPLDLGELSLPKLTERRELLVQTLVDLAADEDASAAALGLGAGQREEIERNATLWTSPTRPALDRYTGVLFDALDARSFTRVQRAKAVRPAGDRVRVVRCRAPRRSHPRLSVVRRVEAARHSAPWPPSGARS